MNQGSLTVNAKATLSGSGVTIVFTSSTGANYATATINGGATINLTPMTSGPTAGITLFADRNIPVGTVFKLDGGASQVITGATYMKTAAIDFTGGDASGTGCAQVVGDTITFSGNSTFTVNCSGYGTKPIGSAASQVVE